MSHSPQKRGLARRFAAGLLAAAMTASCIPAAFAADNDASKELDLYLVWPVHQRDGQHRQRARRHRRQDRHDVLHRERADGTIDKKGGKFVSSDPADGISFYYTTIDPARENFYLQADVTIDYVNPTPDGQEGFALMIRDVIGTRPARAPALSPTWCPSPAPSCPTTG